MIAFRCVASSILIALGLMLISSSMPTSIDEARRTVPKPPTSCQDCKPALVSAGVCE